MAVALAKVGSVPPRRLAGWVVDDSYHVVIPETGAPPEALGEIRYPSQHPDKPVDGDFPLEAAVGEAWTGWIDGLNIGDAAGDFSWWLSTTSGCLGDMPEGKLPSVNIPAGQFQALIVTGTGPIDFWICWMRYVP